MKRWAVLRRTTEPHGWKQVLVPVVVVLSLAVGTSGIGRAVAETPLSARIIQNPATTVRTLGPGQSGEPASEEIWISSDAGPSATEQSAEAKVTETEPVPRTQVTFKGHRPSDSAEVSPLAAAILRFRTPSPAESTPEASQAPSKAVASQATQSSARSELSQAALTLKQSLESFQPDPPSELAGPVSGPRSSQADESLFQTTSSAVKPAALVFRPSPGSDGNQVVPASSQELQQESQQESRPGLQVPSNPMAEPDVQAPLARERRFPIAQAERPLDGGRTSWNVASREPVAARERPIERELPSAAVKRPSVEARFVSPTSRSPASYQRESLRPRTRSASTPRTRTAPQVILRVRVADLHRGSAKTWGLATLGFSQRPPLWRSLTDAEPGEGPILLDLQGNDALERQIQALKQQGVLRVRSEPTLLTASGRPARFATGAGSSDFIAGPDVQPSAEVHASRTDVTLLPLIAEQGDILLEVTCTSSAPYFQTDAGTAPLSRRRQMKVRIRPGQTLAVTGLGLEPSRDEPSKRPNTITRVLGLAKPKGKQPETVMLITPELVGAPPAASAATLAGHTASVPAGSQPGNGSPEAHHVAGPQERREVAEPGAPTESSPSNPLVKMWRMAKRKMPLGKSSEVR